MLTRIDCAHLLTADEHQPYVPAAAVLVRGDAIAWAGPGAQCPATREQADQWLDFSDKIIIPASSTRMGTAASTVCTARATRAILHNGPAN